MIDWIEWKWTEEKPYPETLGTEVYVKYKRGGDGLCSVGFLHDENYELSNWFDHEDDDTITHYRLA